MARIDAGRFSDAATALQAAKNPLTTPPTLAGQDDTPVRDNPAAESVAPTDPWLARPVGEVHVGPSRKAHARSFNDPSNYLG